jgi:urease accessory protein
MQTRPARPDLRLLSRADDCPASAHAAAASTGVAAPAGSGSLSVARVAGESAAIGCRSTTPLRLLVPRPRGRTVWAVAASHGGGLVGGDHVALELDVGEQAQACLTTQAETKVYRSPGAPGRQTTRARVAAGGLLALLPEPVSAYAGAAYTQSQRLELAAGASLVLLDAFTAGRTARGERWAARALRTRNEVAVEGRLVLADAVHLVDGEGPPVAVRMARFDLLATLVLLGPLVGPAAAAILADLAGRPAGSGPVLVAASPLADGLHLRLAATDVEGGMAALRSTLAFLPALLGEDPLSRRP